MRILILQGPFGGFFGYLTRYLRARGHDVTKINFNAGDLLYSWGTSAINYRDGQPHWRAWLRRLFLRWRPDAILLFGDQRPVHRIAIKLARAAQIPVYCCEEGYIRPHFVTFELGGNNANSPLPRRPEDYLAAPEEKPAPPPDLPHHFSRVMWAAFIYFTAKGFGRALFPRYLHHRRRNMFREVFCWLRNYARYQVYNRRDRRTARALLSETAPDFFLAVLQVHDDMQLKRHGNGWTNYRLISAVIASFAAHAPAATRLVVKVHPLDRGHRDYRRKVRKMAEKHGIADRVITLESGPLAPTARKARGVITINSTSGISAIEGHTPVLVLGKSLYNIEGLVTAARTSADIDAFWSDPKPPDPELARRFLAVLRSRSLIPGSFYYPPSWERLCNEIAARIGAEEARWRPVLEHAPAGFELDLARERVALGDS